MTKRRILTAREQYELLTPWQKHADAAQYSLGAQEDAVAANKLIPSQWQELMKAPGTMRLPVGVEADDIKLSRDDSCAKCKGSGRANFGVCNKCFGSGTTTETVFGSANEVLEGWSKDQENKDPSGLRPSDAEPWGNILEQALYKEFMDWWPNSKAAEERLPLLKEDRIPTNWRDYPNEPITHWLNVEDFLQERYPEGHTGSNYGYEQALPLLNKLSQPGSLSPEWLEQQGYLGSGNVITQAMLNLHNKLQGRKWLNDDMRRQYYQLMLKHVGPGARRASRFWKVGYDPRKVVWTPEEKALAAELQSRLDYGWESGRLPRLDPDSPEHFTQALQEMMLMNKEREQRSEADSLDLGYDPSYNDFEASAESGDFDKQARRFSYYEDTPYWLSRLFTADRMIESPPAQYGPAMEILDRWAQSRDREYGKNVPKVYGVKCPTCEGKGKYSWGAMCVGCGGIGSVFHQDLQEKEQPLKKKIEPYANELEQRLYKQFMDWWPTSDAAQKRSPEDRMDGWYTNPHEPIAHWPNIEDFFQENYPEAATGTQWGLEEARPLLKRQVENNPMTPEELEQHGYTGNGNVITQAFLNLHNQVQGRFFDQKADKRRYLELMLRHYGPNSVSSIPRQSGDLDKQASRYSYYDDTAYWAAAWDGWEDDDDDDEVRPKESRRFWAMADTTKWHPMIKHSPRKNTDYQIYEGKYHISLPPERWETVGQKIGELGYTIFPKRGGRFPRKDNEVYIDSVFVHPKHRGQGIGQALVERLGKDFPEHKINPGGTTPEGNGFTERLRAIIPEAESRIKSDYEPYILDDEDTADFNRSELQRLQMARRFWAMAPAEDAYDENPNAYHSSPESKAVRRNDSGKWYHVSPHKLDAGTVLKPGGGESPYGEDHSMPDERRDWVWMDGPEGLKTWYYGTLLGQVKKGVENPWAYIYEVEPSEGPHPWNGTGWEGHAAPSAKIVREIETDKYNRLPDHLGTRGEPNPYRLAFQYELPQGISVTGHPFRKSKGLADEVLDQNGPAILWKALKDRWPGDHHYVARGEDGTIHGVLKGHWGKERFYISDLYSSLKAPSGTGNHLLRSVAQEAAGQGKGLRVINMLNNARPYWEGMGAQTEYNNAHADWSPEGLQALVNGDTIMSPNTEGTMMHNQPIPREHRLPGSARQLAWGRRKLPRSAGKRGDLPEGISFSHGKMFDGRDADRSKDRFAFWHAKTQAPLQN